MTTEQCAELLRREASLSYRLVLASLAAVTEGGQFSDSRAFAAAMDTCDGIIAAEMRLLGAAVAGRCPTPRPSGRGGAGGPDGAR